MATTPIVFFICSALLLCGKLFLIAQAAFANLDPNRFGCELYGEGLYIQTGTFRNSSNGSYYYCFVTFAGNKSRPNFGPNYDLAVVQDPFCRFPDGQKMPVHFGLTQLYESVIYECQMNLRTMQPFGPVPKRCSVNNRTINITTAEGKSMLNISKRWYGCLQHHTGALQAVSFPDAHCMVDTRYGIFIRKREFYNRSLDRFSVANFNEKLQRAEVVFCAQWDEWSRVLIHGCLFIDGALIRIKQTHKDSHGRWFYCDYQKGAWSWSPRNAVLKKVANIICKDCKGKARKLGETWTVCGKLVIACAINATFNPVKAATNRSTCLCPREKEENDDDDKPTTMSTKEPTTIVMVHRKKKRRVITTTNFPTPTTEMESTAKPVVDVDTKMQARSKGIAKKSEAT